jgi:hypothetical protein
MDGTCRDQDIYIQIAMENFRDQNTGEDTTLEYI